MDLPPIYIQNHKKTHFYMFCQFFGLGTYVYKQNEAITLEQELGFSKEWMLSENKIYFPNLRVPSFLQEKSENTSVLWKQFFEKDHPGLFLCEQRVIR
jgi:hypothetical protein